MDGWMDAFLGAQTLSPCYEDDLPASLQMILAKVPQLCGHHHFQMIINK
jgi:hypothetical protein